MRGSQGTDMNPTDTSLPPKQGSRKERAIMALLQYPTLEKAAEAVSVHPVTLWRWCRQPEFHEALLNARREAFSQSVGRLQQASSAAVGTLLRIMADNNAPASSRVRAAHCVLDQSQKALSLEDLELRVKHLEKLNSKPGIGHGNAARKN